MKKRKEKPDMIPVPRNLQDIIPIRTIYPDGIFELKAKGKWSKTFSFTDINYSAAGVEEKKNLAHKYAEVINSIDPEASAEITVNKRKMNMPEFEKNILMHDATDGLNRFRKDYNRIMLDAAKDANMMVRECYITITTEKNSYDEARSFMNRVETELGTAFSNVGSRLKALSAEERLHIFYDFYRAGEEADFHLNLSDMIKYGRDVRTYVCPDSFENKDDYVVMGKRYARTLIIRELASYVKDNIVSKLQGINNTSMMSLSIIPVATDEAVNEVEKRLMGVEKNIVTWQQKQSRRKLPSTPIPYDLEQQRKEVREFLDDLMNRDQRMMYVTMTIVHTADSLEQLDADTDSIKTTARKELCQISSLKYQQLDGLNTVLPLGLRLIDFTRTMTTESMLAFTPFYVQNINDAEGGYYGVNSTSKDIIRINKEKLKNGNMMILAVPGAGKSMLGKHEAFYNYLSDPDTDVIIIDPEREYAVPVQALGGEVIRISASGKNHINVMDLNRDYAIEDDEPVVLKSQFIMSLCEQIIGEGISAAEKSIIDRCVTSVYKEYIANDYSGREPTLLELYEELKKCKEPEAEDIALALELFTTGSLNVFAHETNVNQDSRLLCYDLLDMDEQLQPVGMLAVMDNILNRVTRNRFSGRKTVIIIEELYLYLLYPYSANFLFKLWKRIRKYNGYCVGITQNVRDLRRSSTARTMLSNSEFVIMLSQAEDDMEDLRELLHISEEQMQYVTDADEGCGLIKIGKTLVPFQNKIPKDTELYRLWTTKPGEAVYGV